MRLRRRLLEIQWRLTAERLARSSRPILVGPWRSEVGFEVLYWLPFLEQFRQTYQIPRDRLIAVGRGGSSAWYDMAGRADLFEFLPVEAVRTLTVQASQQSGTVKQYDAPAWETTICRTMATALGMAEYHVLSPKWMYQLVSPFWLNQQPTAWLDRYLLHRVRLPAPPIPEALAPALPERYLAMRWYVRPTWPYREDLLLWMRKLVTLASQHLPVVILDSEAQMDDHADIHLGSIPNCIRLSELTPQPATENLAIQSAVIAKAQGFIGTYGGMAQGAMRWGVPTLAFYENFQQTAPAHLQLTQSLSVKSGVPFVCGTPKQLDSIWPLFQDRTHNPLESDAQHLRA